MADDSKPIGFVVTLSLVVGSMVGALSLLLASQYLIPFGAGEKAVAFN